MCDHDSLEQSRELQRALDVIPTAAMLQFAEALRAVELIGGGTASVNVERKPGTPATCWATVVGRKVEVE